MSDLPKDVNDPEKDAGQEGQSASVAGKGWDILVGGKDNLSAAGGSDPFDFVAPLGAAASTDVHANDAETDAILKSAGAQPAVASMLPTDSASDKGRGAEGLSVSGPQEVSMPGVSAGVTVTPLGAPAPVGPMEITEVVKPNTGPLNSAAIVEISQPEVKPPASAPASAPMMPVFPPPATSGQTSGGILEVSAPLGAGSSSAPKVSMPPARPIPAANPAAPVPFVPGLSLSQSGGFASQVGISDPFASSTDIPLKLVAGDVPPDPEVEKQLITPARVDALWAEINETYDLTINDVRGHFNTTEDAIGELAHARELLLSGPANFDEAEELVKEVKARLRLEEKVRQWSVARGTWLAAYLILWFPLLSLAAFMTDRVNVVAVKYVSEFLVSTYLPAIFGIFGGVIGALWVLNKHITKKRDFDPIHTMWYVTNPFLGGALGVVSYFLIRGGGFLVVTIGGNGTFLMTDITKVILCALSMIVGFNQNVLWSLIDRFLKTVIPETKEDQVAATDSSYGSSSSTSVTSTSTSSSSSNSANPAG